MEIKKNLKALDVKISKLATDLDISRPTLDTYIECYEKGQPIPNEGYQKSSSIYLILEKWIPLISRENLIM